MKPRGHNRPGARSGLLGTSTILTLALLAGCGGSGKGSSGVAAPETGDNFEDFYASIVCPHYLHCCAEQDPAWETSVCPDVVKMGIERYWDQGFSIPRSYNRVAAQECIDLTLQILDNCASDWGAGAEEHRNAVCDQVFAPRSAGKGEHCDLQFVPCDNLGNQRLYCGGSNSGGLVCRALAPVPSPIGGSCAVLNDSELAWCDDSVAFCQLSTAICIEYSPSGSVPNPSGGACAPNLARSSDGTCQPTVEVGGDCELCSQTKSYCTPDGTCALKKPSGEACIEAINGAYTIMCAGTCLSGVCKGNAPLPGLCFSPN